MAFRNLIIASPAKLSVRGELLVIKTEEEHTLPMEDISAVLLEDVRTTVTAAALARLVKAGCALYVCNEKHLPCAVLQPYGQHSRTTQVLRDQLALSAPARKRLWQSIVQAKIGNQAVCLKLSGKKDEGEALESLVKAVTSGDTGNVEAVSAQRYFPLLFGRGFIRGEETAVNAALNYGYAILRGCMARHLAVYGFTQSLGLHHASGLNAFNLADDMMEPYRPVVDLLVYSMELEEEDDLKPEWKRRLFNVLNTDILSGGQHHSLTYAMERQAKSLSRILADGQGSMLLPELIGLDMHRYE